MKTENKMQIDIEYKCEMRENGSLNFKFTSLPNPAAVENWVSLLSSAALFIFGK